MYKQIDKERLIELRKKGYSISEIAKELGLTEKQVYNATHRIRQAGEYIPDARESKVVSKPKPINRRSRRRRGYLEPFSARLDPEILREIKETAARLNISQAVLIERAVIKYLELKG